MNKAGALRLILIITCIELLASIVWPAYILSTQNLELGALIIGVIFAILIIYYLVYLIFIIRYSRRNPMGQSISLAVLLNVLPIIFYVIVLLFT